MALAAEKRDMQMQMALERDVRLVRFEDGRLEFAPAKARAPPDLAADLSASGSASGPAGAGWSYVSSEAGQPTLREKADAEKRDRDDAACGQTRWCAPCWSASPAPRSSACATAPDAARRRGGRPRTATSPMTPIDFDGIDDDDALIQLQFDSFETETTS